MIAEQTDWPQILGLYRLLEQLAPRPMVRLGHAVAVGMVDGPAAGLLMVDALASDERFAAHHRLQAVRAHLLEMAGDRRRAVASYRSAARATTNIPEQRYLQRRADDLTSNPTDRVT